MRTENIVPVVLAAACAAVAVSVLRFFSEKRAKTQPTAPRPAAEVKPSSHAENSQTLYGDLLAQTRALESQYQSNHPHVCDPKNPCLWG